MTNKYGLSTALISFIIGTLLLVAFYFSNSISITIFGIFFIAIAGIVNLSVLIKVLINLIKEKEHRKKHMLTSGIIILNIPIAILYFYIVMFLLNTMRISLINETGSNLTDLKIIGGETKLINELKTGDKQTEWVEIKSETPIILQYKLNGEIKTESIHSYPVTGERINHRIGNNSNKIENTY
ncbi:hypothetical protein [uncultured Lutibacter sp.]|uniref:hypothetical protein n=1 Tax=uncultured Lutibacter sp. TaxID=437739 RepID=UPI002604F5D4|nr:hypothetical protein [uncultured Lutibacter sp.]